MPKDVAICPECGGRLHAESSEYETETGKPTIGGIYLTCQRESKDHRFLQSDWQPIYSSIDRWAGAVST